MTSQNKQAPQLIISGFHRSGTSLTAQYLHLAGLNLGTNLIGSNPSNPDGHFEHHEFVSLHKDILSANNREWYTLGGDLSSSATNFEHQARTLLKQFPADQPMGFKDPRSSLLLPWWHRQLENPAAVIVFRHYASCYHSLRNRQAQNLVFSPDTNSEALLFWQQPRIALELWISYNDAILEYVRANRNTSILVSHHAMLSGFNLPAAVNETVGLHLDTQCDSGIRTGHTTPLELPEPIAPELYRRLERTLASLNDLCTSDPEPAHRATDTGNKIAAIVSTPIGHVTEAINQRLDQLKIPQLEQESSVTTKLSNDDDTPVAESKIGFADDSDDVKELLHWGKIHQANESDHSAEECWLKAHAIAPRNQAPLLHLALLARNHGENEETVRLMREAIERKSDDAGFYFHLARALKDCGKSEQALKCINDGLKLQDGHRDLHLLELDILLLQGEYPTALKVCEHTLQLFPNDERYMKIMARIAEVSKDSHSAMIWFRRSVLTRIKQRKAYRSTLLQAIEQVPAAERPALSQRVIIELDKLEDDALPKRSNATQKRTLRLAMSILVRDEADVIRENILFHAAAGVEHFIVTDNGSIDGTREILEELTRQVPLTIIDEPSHTIDQDLWVTRMALKIRDENIADWIINNDADEFWLSPGRSLKEAIAHDLENSGDSTVDIGTLYCQRFNLIPSAESVAYQSYRFYDNHYKVMSTLTQTDQANPWHENNSNSLIRTLPGKVISRLEGLQGIDMGNHGAQHQSARLDSSCISIAHYPVRTFEQFERKVINYGKSLANNSRFEQNVSRHLRFWYEQQQQGNLYEEYQKFVLPEQRLEQLINDGILCNETDIGPEIAAAISPPHASLKVSSGS